MLSRLVGADGGVLGDGESVRIAGEGSAVGVEVAVWDLFAAGLYGENSQPENDNHENEPGDSP